MPSLSSPERLTAGVDKPQSSGQSFMERTPLFSAWLLAGGAPGSQRGWPGCHSWCLGPESWGPGTLVEAAEHLSGGRQEIAEFSLELECLILRLGPVAAACDRA